MNLILKLIFSQFHVHDHNLHAGGRLKEWSFRSIMVIIKLILCFPFLMLTVAMIHYYPNFVIVTMKLFSLDMLYCAYIILSLLICLNRSCLVFKDHENLMAVGCLQGL